MFRAVHHVRPCAATAHTSRVHARPEARESLSITRLHSSAASSRLSLSRPVLSSRLPSLAQFSLLGVHARHYAKNAARGKPQEKATPHSHSHSTSISPAFEEILLRKKAKKQPRLNIPNILPEFDKLTKNLDLAVTKSPVAGRGVFALKKFEQGDEILTEIPFALGIDSKSNKHDFCTFCMRSLQPVVALVGDENTFEPGISDMPKEHLDNLKEEVGMAPDPVPVKCGTCEDMYCSDACKSRAWSEQHQALCNNPIYHRIDDGPGADLTRYLVLICGKMELELTHGHSLWNDVLQHLTYDTAEVKEPLAQSEELLLVHLMKAFPKLATTKLLTAEGIQRLKSIINHNTFTHVSYLMRLRLIPHTKVSPDDPVAEVAVKLKPGDAATEDTEEEPEDQYYVMPDMDTSAMATGSAMYFLAGMLNHSCDPNVIVLPAVNNETTFAAVKDIKPGEELFFPYIGEKVDKPVHERQKILQETFNFVCKCPRCKAEEHSPVISISDGSAPSAPPKGDK